MAGRVYWLDPQRPRAQGAQDPGGLRFQAVRRVTTKGKVLTMKIGEAFP